MKLSEKRHHFLWMLNDMLNYIRPVIEQNGIIIYIKELYRDPKLQHRYYDEGKSNTMQGKHPLGLAVDIVLIKDNSFVEKSPIYDMMGEWWKDNGGRWGGDWKDPYDPYHFEFSLKRWKLWKEDSEK